MNQFQLSWIAASRIKQSIFQHLLWDRKVQSV
jgi:hypothetical protein